MEEMCFVLVNEVFFELVCVFVVVLSICCFGLWLKMEKRKRKVRGRLSW